jgi:hypothetical protein
MTMSLAQKLSILGVFCFITLCHQALSQEIIRALKFKSLENGDRNTTISRYEVTNGQYSQFLRESGRTQFQYDSTKWQLVINEDLSPFVQSYHWHPAFLEYPIVNITYDGATAFCQWLTEVHQARSDRHMIFRLPSVSEMEMLVAQRTGDLISNYHEDYACDFVGNLKYRNAQDSLENYNADGALFTSPVTKFNQNGLNSIIGNVSEICQGGDVLGGNWYTLPEDVHMPEVIALPDPRVGFRVVCEKE